MKTIYLAGPIAGLTYDEGNEWRLDAIEMLSAYGIQGVSPLRDKEFLRGRGKLLSRPDAAYYSGRDPQEILATQKGVMCRDYYDCTHCDMVLAYLKGAQKMSAGTIMEMAWCYAFKVPLIVVMEPQGCNPHEHIMIAEAMNYRVETLEEAVAVAASFLGVHQ